MPEDTPETSGPKGSQEGPKRYRKPNEGFKMWARKRAGQRQETTKEQTPPKRGGSETLAQAQVEELLKTVRSTEEKVGRVETKLGDIEKLIEERTRAILDQMRLPTSKLHAFQQKLVDQFSSSIELLNNMIEASKQTLATPSEAKDNALLLEEIGKMKAAVISMENAQKGMASAFEKSAQAQRELTDVQYQQLYQSQAQLPPELQVPTREIVAMRELTKEGKDITRKSVEAKVNEIIDKPNDEPSKYEAYVLEWYEKTAKDAEKDPLATFEEKSQHLSALILTITHLSLRPETRALGEYLGRDLESRRVNKSMTKAHDRLLPSQAVQFAPNVSIHAMGQRFTHNSYETDELVEVVDPETGQPKKDKNGNVIKRKRRESDVSLAFKKYQKMYADVIEIQNEIDIRSRKERRIREMVGEKRVNKKRLTPTELQDLDNLIKERRVLEKELARKKEKIRKCYTEGGETTVKDGSRLEQILVQKKKADQKTISIKEGVALLEESRIEVEKAIKSKKNQIMSTDRNGNPIDLDKEINKIVNTMRANDIDPESNLQRLNELRGKEEMESREGRVMLKRDQEELDSLESDRDLVNLANLLNTKIQIDRTINSMTLLVEGIAAKEKQDRLGRKPLTARQRQELNAEKARLNNLVGSNNRLRELEKLIREHVYINSEIEDLQDEAHAMIIAGGMSRWGHESARADVVKDSTGDFMVARLMHMGPRLESRYPLTRGITNPLVGEYANQYLDFGIPSFYREILVTQTKVARKQTIEEAIDLLRNKQQGGGNFTKEDAEKLEGLLVGDADAINDVLTGRDTNWNWLKSFKIDKAGSKDIDLTNAELASEELWRGLLEDFGVQDNLYVAEQMDREMKADESRSKLWQQGNHFDNPSIETFRALSELFTWMVPELRKKFFNEILSRDLNWMELDPDAPEAVEKLLVFPAAEKNTWIEEASRIEMITNKMRDDQLKKHVDLPFWPGSPRDKAQMRVFFDTMYGILWRYYPIRNKIALGTLWEWIKNLLTSGFRYTLAEEMR